MVVSVRNFTGSKALWNPCDKSINGYHSFMAQAWVLGVGVVWWSGVAWYGVECSAEEESSGVMWWSQVVWCNLVE